jgi:general secretion pathway protein N
MRKSGLSVPVAALLSGVFTAAAAQEPLRDSVFPPGEPALSTHSLGRAPTVPPRSVAIAKNKPLAGNPLWAIALGELSETHARPLFSPSRRPPAPAVVAALPPLPVKPASPIKPEPDHPLLTLVGTTVGEAVEIGVFIDQASHDVIRIRAGEAHGGWTLSAISGRAAMFEKEGYRAATLVLPAPGAEPAKSGGGAPAIKFAPPVIPATTKGGSKRPPREG